MPAGTNRAQSQTNEHHLQHQIRLQKTPHGSSTGTKNRHRVVRAKFCEVLVMHIDEDVELGHVLEVLSIVCRENYSDDHAAYRVRILVVEHRKYVRLGVLEYVVECCAVVVLQDRLQHQTTITST